MVIKVVIVEDKPPILWSIKQKIENYSAEIKVVGEAYNGQEALPLIKELKPDIVFTDIRMPIVDGLELITQIKKTHFDTKFIIISGYDEFEYARQAMKLGVSDYILKPVTQEMINDILDKTMSDLKVQFSKSEKKVLQDILNLGNNLNIASHHFNYRYFVMALICAGSYSNQIIDYANPFNFFASKVNFDEIISKHLQQNLFFWCFDGKSLNEMILLLGASGDSDFDVKQLISSVSEDLLSLSIPVTIVLSRKVYNINDIGIEAQNARTFLRRNLVFGKSSIIYCDVPNVNTIEKTSILGFSLEKKLISFIQGNQKALFFNEIKNLVDYFDQNSFTQYNIENSLKYIVHPCNKATVEKSDIHSDLELEIEEVLSISKDYTALLNGLNSIFSQFFIDNNDLRQRREPMKEIVEKVEKYINTNYAEQITINDIADMVKVDPCHLSKSFKNAKGMSPMEYLTNLRIKKSKELIASDSNLMLKDIAEIVGYTNQYYFSRIFKIVTGLSPSEYKNSL